MGRYHIEIIRELIDELTGETILTIRPDYDNLGLVTIKEQDNTIDFAPEQARLVAKAMIDCADEMDKKDTQNEI
jgi:hypothetical protein